MATISIQIIDASASVNTTRTLTISDADAAILLNAYAVSYPGTMAQTITGWCNKVFSDMLAVAYGYKLQQAQNTVTQLNNTIS